MIIIEIAIIWVLALMVFYANPVNDPNMPESEMNRWHPLNIDVKADVGDKLEAVGEDREMDIEWPDIAPYLNASQVTVLCLLIKTILTQMF